MRNGGKRSLEIVAWTIIGLSVIVLVYNGKYVKALLRSSIDTRRLVYEEVGPRETLLLARNTAVLCSKPNEEFRRQNYKGSHSKAALPDEYDPIYNERIDRRRVAWKFFPKSSGGDSSSLLGPSVDFSHCMAKRLLSDLSLRDWNRLEQRVMWIHLYFEDSTGGVFLAWPAFDIPDDFVPSKRPWYYENVERDNAGMFILTGNSPVYSTSPYSDAFTREPIVTLVTPIQGPDARTRMTVAVDVKTGPKPGLFSLVLLLNLLVSILVSVGNALILRTFSESFFRAWQRGWLLLAVLYSVHCGYYFSRSDTLLSEAYRTFWEPAVVMFSIANSAFFLLSGLLLALPERARTSRRVTSLIFAPAAVIAAFSTAMSYRVRSVDLGVLIEAALSFLALSALGVSLVLICWRCGQGADSRVLRWARPVGGLVLAFFLGNAFLQVLIPVWNRWPTAEDIFWFVSIVMKIAIVGLFFIVVLMEFYWEKAEVNSVYFDKFPHGIIAVDSRFRIVNVNQFMAKDLNLSILDMQGRFLSEVVFLSWFQTEDLFSTLREQGEVEDELTMETKYYSTRDRTRFSVVERLVSASLVAGGETRGTERVYALFFLRRPPLDLVGV